jgi:hypothetical protein
MSELFAVAGSKIYIGGVLPADRDDMTVGDFAGQTWLEIDGWETAGVVGDASELISTALINRGRMVKQKGTNNAGSSENNFAIAANDPGQDALRAAQRSKSSFAFKIEWTGGEVQLFVALVMSQTRAGGSADTVQMLNATLEINSNVVDV